MLLPSSSLHGVVVHIAAGSCKHGRRYYPPMPMLEVAARVRRYVACVLLGLKAHW